jgi:hypothetical protein
MTLVYILKIAKDELSAYSASSELCNKPPFSALTISVCLAFRGRWTELAYGTSGVSSVLEN